jgi:hypothetical protein
VIRGSSTCSVYITAAIMGLYDCDMTMTRFFVIVCLLARPCGVLPHKCTVHGIQPVRCFACLNIANYIGVCCGQFTAAAWTQPSYRMQVVVVRADCEGSNCSSRGLKIREADAVILNTINSRSQRSRRSRLGFDNCWRNRCSCIAWLSTAGILTYHGACVNE